MRYFLCGFLFLIGSVSAFGSLPYQSPIVKDLREKFQKGRVPTLDELRMGEQWRCRNIGALKDTVGPGNSYSKDDLVFKAADMVSRGIFTNHEFILPGVTAGVHTYFRVYGAKDQTLIIEVTGSYSLVRLSLALPSVSEPCLSAVLYGYCWPEGPAGNPNSTPSASPEPDVNTSSDTNKPTPESSPSPVPPPKMDNEF